MDIFYNYNIMVFNYYKPSLYRNKKCNLYNRVHKLYKNKKLRSLSENIILQSESYDKC